LHDGDFPIMATHLSLALALCVLFTLFLQMALFVLEL
jgi:hypothetical protein